MASDTAKTDSSLRTMPLVTNFREMLLAKKEKQEHYRKLCGRSYCKEYLDYIFVNEMGERWKPRYLSDGFKRILEQNGLRRIRFHDLRHTCASLLLANNVPMKKFRNGSDTATSPLRQIFTLILTFNQKYLRQKQC
ncbi:MAG: tyrosine-type recombinase/integrase [Oscillospiraceae bacterium]